MNTPFTVARPFILAGALVLSGSTFADDGTGLRTMAIKYGDLNLADPQAVATLYRRITLAAEDVCGPETQTGSRVTRARVQACVARAVSDAVAIVGRPELTAYHALRDRHVPPPAMAATGN